MLPRGKSKKTVKNTFVLLLFFLGPFVVEAAPLHVSTTGTDSSGCGASTSPCRTLQYVVNYIGDGLRDALDPYKVLRQIDDV